MKDTLSLHDALPISIGWRFVNPVTKKAWGIDSMPETGENVAEEIGRAHV